MSKILASIADAEDGAYLHPRSRSQGDQVTSRATAARAEHAEIVATARVLRTPHMSDGQVVLNEIHLTFCTPDDAQSFMAALNSLDTLLSRVGGG